MTKNGVFLLEGFSPDQLKYATGGPKNLDLLIDLNETKKELSGLEFYVAMEIEREIFEGLLHKGNSSVTQIIGIKK